MSSNPPPISSLQPMTPPALDRVVKKCLRKDRDDRWQCARDVTDELKWITESGSDAGASVQTPAVKGIRALGRRGLILALGAFLLATTIIGLAVWNLRPSPTDPHKTVSRFTITLPPGQQLAGLENGPAVALSPDGTHLVYVARQSGIQRLYLRAMDSLESNPILGTEGAIEPFFSPDGQWVGFFVGQEMKKISLSGGAALSLGIAIEHGGASWGSQGMIAFAPRINGVLQQVSNSGGTPQPVTRGESGG